MLKTLPDESVHCVVTSPPYWGLRDYGVAGQLGLEQSPQAFVNVMVEVFAEVRRVLRNDGTVWLNLGDSYASNPSKGGSGPGGKNGYGENYARAMRKGSGRADGLVTEESPRNRDGAPACDLAAKNLIGIPWRVAFALQADGWWLRSDVIWAKPNPMPESVTDRPTKAHEYIFLLSKSDRYYFDAEAVREKAERPEWMYETATDPGNKDRQDGGCTQRKPKERGHVREHEGFRDKWDGMSKAEQSANGRNIRSVWTVATHPFAEAHFATFPPALIKPCVLAGCPVGGTVLDPFGGAGTTGLVADRHQRDAILIELNPEYAEMARKRIFNDAPLFADVA